MTEIRKSLNTYRRHDGYLMSWERDDSAQIQAIMMNEYNDPIIFAWRAPSDPKAGNKISIVMHEKGISAKRDRPLLLLDHDGGHLHRERNAPSPVGARRIMVSLTIWVLLAMLISGIIIANTNGLTMMTLVLLTTAFVVWRLAIATKDVRMDERAQTRLQEEEQLCLDIMTSEWRLAAEQAFHLRKGEKD